MKKLLLILFVSFVSVVSFSQPAEMIVKTGQKGLYIDHEVVAKEGLFSIGRMYNVHPRHISNFNDWNFNQGLSIGQVLHIPLTDTNFSQAVNRGVPVYYISMAGENISAVAKKINNADPQKLQGWNPGRTGSLTAGTKLLAGFLITNELKDRVTEVKPSAAPPAKEVTAPPKEEVVINKPPAEVKPKEEVKKETEKPREPVVKEEKKTEEAKAASQPVPVRISDKEFGYFRNDFIQQVKTFPMTKGQTVTSSIFKTVSGWGDDKFYLLINDVEPGTIVKITNPENGKIAYAKTLYSMDKVRKNQGVDIRISDATASILSIYETDKFVLRLDY